MPLSIGTSQAAGTTSCYQSASKMLNNRKDSAVAFSILQEQDVVEYAVCTGAKVFKRLSKLFCIMQNDTYFARVTHACEFFVDKFARM